MMADAEIAAGLDRNGAVAMHLAVLLIEGFADWEHGHLTAPVREFFDGRVTFHTPGGGRVVSVGGMRVETDGAAENLSADAFDALAVIGSANWFEAGAPDLATLYRAVDAAEKPLGFICGATLAAARAGLLNVRPHTSNNLDTLKKTAAYKGEAHYRDVPRAVRDGRLVTAAGECARSFALEMAQLMFAGQDEQLGWMRYELTREVMAPAA
jgi:putative intracellular protease/amidase